MNREIVKIGNVNVVPSRSSNDWRDVVGAFVVSQDMKETTRSLYARELKLFFEWVERTGRTIKDLSCVDILTYKDELIKQGMSSLTISSYLTAIRKFYAWTESERMFPNIANGVKLPKREQQFVKQDLTINQSTKLLEFCKTTMSKRDFAIVNLLLRCGLRTIELVRADISDITFRGEQRILRVWGKGHDGKDDFVVLTDKAFQPIDDYLKTERKNAKTNEPLFTSENHSTFGTRLTTRSISRICKNSLRAIGLDARDYSAHSLRHTTACLILDKCGDLSKAQIVLRHTNISTTQIYVKSKQRRERLEKDKAPENLIDEMI